MRGRPTSPKLSSQQILRVARQLANAEGASAVTMRRLASALGVLPNALYTYFPSREVLLNELVDNQLGSIQLPDERGHERWATILAAMFRALYLLLVDNRWLPPLLISRPTLGPHALHLAETGFELLDSGGLDHRQKANAFYVLMTYTVGFAVFQVSRPPAKTAGAHTRAARASEIFSGLPQGPFPMLKSLAGQLALGPTETDFEQGLAWIMSSIEAQSA
jgi:AcrR family transcriptional regulator